MPNPDKLVRIHPTDNVAVAVQSIEPGTRLRVGDVTVTARDPIPQGHKVALVPLQHGDHVVKYGEVIGHCTEDVKPGSHVHVHNVKTNLEGILEYEYVPQLSDKVPLDSPATFDAYIRANGDVGIRNEIWIIPTVGCVNKICERLARQGRDRLMKGNVEGIHAFVHPYGCSQFGDDLLNTQRILAGLVRHPNAAGILIVGLGCEHNNISELGKVLGDTDPQRVKYFAAQQVEDEFQTGLKLLEQLAEHAQTCQRQPVSDSKLKIGLKCGGSDAFSGITANPLLGALSDRIARIGGTTLMTEVPEMFGAETILMKRCINRQVFDKCVRLINDFKTYLMQHDRPICENPTPGNQDGGITTLEDKSLGCTQKGGTSPVTDILKYAERATRPGLNLLSAPSNDLVSVSALAASGTQMVLFTTGRGTPFGGPVPTVKLATTTELAQRKKSWIDFDAGVLLTGTPMHELADDLFDFILQVASGNVRTKNEENDFRELTIFKSGVTA